MPALDPAMLSQRQGIGIEDVPSAHSPPVERDAPDRPDERDEDREDDTDRAIKLAREHVIEAVNVLIGAIQYPDENPEIRMKAAIALLEVAGCL